MPDIMEHLARDFRYAFRMLARSPAFTLVVVLSLAVAIAVNSTMFGVVSSLLLRPLGSGGNDLVRIGRTARGERSFKTVSYEEFSILRDRSRSLASVMGYDIASATLRVPDGTRPVSVEIVAGPYFTTLGVPPTVGRVFRSGEDGPEATDAVAIVSDRFARRSMSAEQPSAIVGRQLTLNDVAFTVVGVAPAGFSGAFPGVATDVWIPAGMASVTQDRRERGTPPNLLLVGRLAPGVSMQSAAAELEVVASQLAQDDPAHASERTFILARARGALPVFASVLRVFLSLLMGIVGVVLLIACVNVAGLLLARAVARRAEIAVRLAMGASRRRVVGQLLTESVLLAVAGGLAGALLTLWPMHLLNGLTFIPGPTGTPVFLDLRLDAQVFGFTAVITMLTALAFGLVPALQSTRPGVMAALKDLRSVGRRGAARFRLGSALVAVQVGVSFVLLVGAMLFVRSLRNTEDLDVGFDPDGLTVVTVALDRLSYDRMRSDQFFVDLLSRARAAPGVQGAALSSVVPLGGTLGHPVALSLPGAGSGPRNLGVRVARVSDGYFATMRQPLVQGREFTQDDQRPGRHLAIVNEAMARRHWPRSNPVGRRIGLGEGLVEHEIVGVAADARYSSFGGDIEPLVFVPGFSANRLVLRSAIGDARPLVRLLVGSIDTSAVPHVTAETLRQSMSASMSLVPVRIARVVLCAAGIIAVLLATGGLSGLVSYTAQQRMREVGIRVALGADRRDVLRVLAGGAFRMAMIGLGAGIIIALAVTRLLTSFLYGLSPTDPITFASVGLSLITVTLLAGYVASRRALAVDPVVVLRYE